MHHWRCSWLADLGFRALPGSTGAVSSWGGRGATAAGEPGAGARLEEEHVGFRQSGVSLGKQQEGDGSCSTCGEPARNRGTLLASF